MRTALLLCLTTLFCTCDLAAQLSLDYGTGGEVAGAVFRIEKPSEGLRTFPLTSVSRRRTVVPLFTGREVATPQAFDFTRTAPHLAFFCRLEINEEAGYVIPVKFRLGGHQHWQDNLLR